jgi:hypothetical protein
VIEFCFDSSCYHNLIVLTGSLRRFTQAEIDDEALEIEKKDGSCSLMKQSHMKLSRNTMMTVKHHDDSQTPGTMEPHFKTLFGMGACCLSTISTRSLFFHNLAP